jgi:transposase
MKEEKFASKKIRRRPKLTEQHKADRLTFARQRLSEKFDFSTTVFSDEKKFRMDGPDGWNYFWAALGDKTVPDCYSKDYGRYRGVMVWMAISSHGVLSVERVRGKLDGEAYSAMVRGDAAAKIHAAHGTAFVFQQDNAPPHRATSTVEELTDAGFTLLPWPALSPDLNPVENVWSLIVREVYADGKYYNDEDSLWVAIEEAARRMPQAKIAGLIGSMEKRLCDVLSFGGGYAQ